MAVADWQFELDGVTFGAGTDYRVSELTLPKPEARVFDADAAREDGTSFGRDHLTGLLVTFEIGVVGTGPDGVLDKVATLRRAWYGDATRATSGASVPLVMRRPGRDPVRMFGRPRRFDPASHADVASGYVPVVCDFQAVDPYLYSDTVGSTSVTIVPPPVGGLIEPLTDPLVGVQSGEAQGHIDIAGSDPAWLVIRILGPVTDPEISVTGLWSARLRLTLADGEYLDVDPQPWARSVRRNDRSNAAGAFTAASQRLSVMRVPPGPAEVVLRGVDATGTASATFSWRSAYSSF